MARKRTLQTTAMAVTLIVLAPAAAAPAYAADRYAVSLTRKDQNLYKVDGKQVWVQTRYSIPMFMAKKRRWHLRGETHA